MLGRSITSMSLKPVARESVGKPPNQSVASLFRQHTRSCYGCMAAITTHDGALRTLPQSQWEHSIHQDQLRRARQAMKSTHHGLLSRGAYPVVINGPRRALSQPPSMGMSLNQRDQCSSTCRS